MAGAFGQQINSRKDFQHLLIRTRKLGGKVAERLEDPALDAINQQLDFVSQTTKNGRTPTREERKSLDMGLRMSREYEEIHDDDELYDFKEQVLVIELYFQFWPNDEIAADPDNDDLIDWDEPST